MTVSPDDLHELLGTDDRELKVLEKLLQIRETRLEFALEHHVNTRGDRMDFVHYPHIRALYESTSNEMVLQGSVQSFKSEWAVIDHFATAYNGLSVFYVVPKYEARNTYVQNRINKCVENVAEYKKIIGAGFFDSVALKSFGRGTVKYVGSNVLADFKEFPADMIVVEEVDECDAENVNYALDRLRASPYQFKRYLGNPKHKGYGINAFFLRSDQREWEVPCKECLKFSQLDWFETVVQVVLDREGAVVDYTLRDTDWEPGCKRDIRCICTHCGGELDRASESGTWTPTKPDSSIEGYHISMLCSLINSVAGMWDRFKRAIHDPAKMQQFYNSDLGLPYSAMGNKVTETLLANCSEEDYEFEIDPDGSCAHVAGDAHPGPCSMGVDVGGNFDVRISYLEARGHRRAVYIGKVKNIDDLYDMIDRYNVERVVMDSMPEIMMAQEFQEVAVCDVWLCSYRGEGKDRRRSYDTRNRMVFTDRTEALDRSFAQLKRRQNILPTNFPLILKGQYASEMCMPVREIIENDKGDSRYEWSKGKDHQRHCDTYDMLAAMLMMDSVVDDVTIG
jgi:hypothetical protein